MNRPIQVILASGSNLFLEGIGSILEEENDIEIAAKASSYEELEMYLAEIKPQFLFLDNKTLELDVHKLENLVDKKVAYPKIILLGVGTEEGTSLPNVICLTKDTNSLELIRAIRGSQTQKGKSSDSGRSTLTNMEQKVVDLIGAGFGNKEVAEKLSISEKTVKAHLTNIFAKLGIQNRYQLIVYAQKPKN